MGVRAVPQHCILYFGICLTTEEYHGKPQSGQPKGARLNSAVTIRLIDLAIASDGLVGLLAAPALGFRVRRRGQPSVSVSICQVAVLGGSPHQLTFSQSSQSGF